MNKLAGRCILLQMFVYTGRCEHILECVCTCCEVYNYAAMCEYMLVGEWICLQVCLYADWCMCVHGVYMVAGVFLIWQMCVDTGRFGKGVFAGMLLCVYICWQVCAYASMCVYMLAGECI